MRRTLLLFCFALLSTLSACAGAQRPARSPDALALNGDLANRFVPAGARSTLVARIHLATAAVDPSAHPPINLALVVDTSGSMEGRAIDDARAASLALLDALRDGDRLAVVTFDSRAEVIVPSVELDAHERAEARRRIGAMRARGTTDMGNGLRLGVEQVAAHLNTAGINRVVLLGDGVPNDAAGIEAMAASAGSHGITITAMGLGLEYNETLMGAIAQRSGGHFHYVEDSSAVATAFRTEVLRMERVVARNATVTINPGPDVQIEAIVGHEATRTNEGVSVALGEITEGATRDLIVRLNVPSHRTGSPVELVDARLGWNDPAAPAVHYERDLFLGAHATSDAAEIERGRSAEVEAVAAQVTLAVGTVAAIREARSGNVEQASAQLDGLLDRARAAAQDEASPAYRRQVSNVSSLRHALASTSRPARGPARPDDTRPAPAAPRAPEVQAAVNSAHDEALGVIDGY
jgi:Ca-activated chloride channel family protein